MRWLARAVLVVSVVATTAHADPSSDDLVGGFAGLRLPGPGTIGRLAIGRLQPWFMCALGVQGGLRVGRLALVGEGELDPSSQKNELMMIRGGADLRLSLIHGRGAWSPSHRGNWERRTAYDVFVEGGAGEQVFASTTLPTVTRPDVELGAGAALGGGRRWRSGRILENEVYLRVRVLVAPSPLDPAITRCSGACTETSQRGNDLGVFVDFATVFGS